MASIEGLGWTFDTVAETYQKLRPGYVKELYDKELEIQEDKETYEYNQRFKVFDKRTANANK